MCKLNNIWGAKKTRFPKLKSPSATAQTTTVGQLCAGSWGVNEKCVKCRRPSQHFSWKHNSCRVRPARCFKKNWRLWHFIMLQNQLLEGITVSQVVTPPSIKSPLTSLQISFGFLSAALKHVWHNSPCTFCARLGRLKLRKLERWGARA